MGEKKYRAAVERFQYIFDQLEQLKVQEMDHLEESNEAGVCFLDDDDNVEMDNDDNVMSEGMKRLEKLYEKFEAYCKELVVFGFNSAGYNVKLIKNWNILEEEYAAFQKLVDQGKSKWEALQILCLTSKPKTGPESYQWLQQLWTENQWSTFADFLKWCNDLDVTPMIQAIENMNESYKQKHIDFMH